MKKLFQGAATVALALALGACGQSAEPTRETEAGTSGDAASPAQYTIIFDKNTTPDDLTDDESFTYYTTGWGAEQKSSVIQVPMEEGAYIPADDVPTPSRKGYYFAGWQTVPVVEDSDIVNGVSRYQVFFGAKYSEFGEAVGASGGADAMPIADFDTLTEDGTLTLYARWVEAKEVSTEEELRAMGDDLYGAYVLVNDITLTEPWEPIGAYFDNYEHFQSPWWTYAFKGTLDGAGHTIYGLTVNGAEREVPVTAATEGAIWNDDGDRVDGTAALFSAITGATICDLTIDGAVIDVSGDNAYSGPYCYVAPLASFDMQSTIKNVHVTNTTVRLSYDDAASGGASMFITAAGLVGGGWTDSISGCTVDATTVDVVARTEATHGGECYVGGLVGECYSNMQGNTVDVALSLDLDDASQAADDTPLSVNVGGNSAANTSTSGDTVDAAIDVSVGKPTGAATVNIGGFTGSQRYMSASDNTITADITTDIALDPELGTLNVGSVMGRIDAFYATLILIYADGITCGSTGNTTEVTLNGEPLDAMISETGMPSIDGEPLTYIATGDYADAEGNVYQANLDKVLEAYGSMASIGEATGDDARIMYIAVE